MGEEQLNIITLSEKQERCVEDKSFGTLPVTASKR